MNPGCTKKPETHQETSDEIVVSVADTSNRKKTATGGRKAGPRRRDRRATANERGAGTILTIMMIWCTLLAAGAATIVGGYAIAAHRARSAADLAALSGAIHQSKEGGVISQSGRTSPGCARATESAQRNGASLRRCEVAGDYREFVLGVVVEVRVGVVLTGLPASVRAQAYAGSLDGVVQQQR